MSENEKEVAPTLTEKLKTFIAETDIPISDQLIVATTNAAKLLDVGTTVTNTLAEQPGIMFSLLVVDSETGSHWCGGKADDCFLALCHAALSKIYKEAPDMLSSMLDTLQSRVTDMTIDVEPPDDYDKTVESLLQEHMSERWEYVLYLCDMAKFRIVQFNNITSSIGYEYLTTLSQLMAQSEIMDNQDRLIHKLKGQNEV